MTSRRCRSSGSPTFGSPSTGPDSSPNRATSMPTGSSGSSRSCSAAPPIDLRVWACSARRLDPTLVRQRRRTRRRRSGHAVVAEMGRTCRRSFRRRRQRVDAVRAHPVRRSRTAVDRHLGHPGAGGAAGGRIGRSSIRRPSPSAQFAERTDLLGAVLSADWDDAVDSATIANATERWGNELRDAADGIDNHVAITSFSSGHPDPEAAGEIVGMAFDARCRDRRWRADRRRRSSIRPSPGPTRPSGLLDSDRAPTPSSSAYLAD